MQKYKNYINFIMPNLTKRFISGIILGSIVLFAILYSQLLLNLSLILMGSLMLHEWRQITNKDEKYLHLGLIIIIVPILSLYLVSIKPEGKIALLTYALVIAAVDTFAMFGGKTFKGRKLAPIISPNKTWSGLVSGATAGAVVSLCISFIIRKYNVQYSHIEFFFFGLFIGLIEQCSDLFISFFKRKFSVKDSGNIIPGHGGVLDRFDGIILTAPILLWIL